MNVFVDLVPQPDILIDLGVLGGSPRRWRSGFFNSLQMDIAGTFTTGSPPMVVASQRKVVNLNSDYLDDKDWSSISLNILCPNSVRKTGDLSTALTLDLVGDVLAPAVGHYYGTGPATQAKGWYQLPPGNVGTVTSIGLTMPTAVFNVTPATPITGSGAFDVTFDNQSANTVFAGPATGTAQPTFRFLVEDDLPFHTHPYQPLDPDLTAIAALGNSPPTTGYSKRTAANTWALITQIPASDVALPAPPIDPSSGTPDYVAVWKGPGTKLLGTGLIRDDTATVGINTAPLATALLSVVKSWPGAGTGYQAGIGVDTTSTLASAAWQVGVRAKVKSSHTTGVMNTIGFMSYVEDSGALGSSTQYGFFSTGLLTANNAVANRYGYYVEDPTGSSFITDKHFGFFSGYIGVRTGGIAASFGSGMLFGLNKNYGLYLEGAAQNYLAGPLGIGVGTASYAAGLWLKVAGRISGDGLRDTSLLNKTFIGTDPSGNLVEATLPDPPVVPTVTYAIRQPPSAGGIQVSNSGLQVPIGYEWIFTLKDDLASVEALSTTGYVFRTEPNAWTTVAKILWTDITVPALPPAGWGTVTSVGVTQPAEGLTISPSVITTSGTFIFTLANDLGALEGLNTTGFARRTGISTWITQSVVESLLVTVPTSGLTVSSAIAQTGIVTVGLGLSGDLAALEALGTSGYAKRTHPDAWSTSSKIPWGDVDLPQVGVTSVGLSIPTDVFNITVPTVTATGTLTAIFQPQAQKTFFAGPLSGSNATPAFRPLVYADISDPPVIPTVPTPPILPSSGLNDYVARWVDDANVDPLSKTLSYGLIRDNNIGVGINAAPSSLITLNVGQVVPPILGVNEYHTIHASVTYQAPYAGVDNLYKQVFRADMAMTHTSGTHAFTASFLSYAQFNGVGGTTGQHVTYYSGGAVAAGAFLTTRYGFHANIMNDVGPGISFNYGFICSDLGTPVTRAASFVSTMGLMVGKKYGLYFSGAAQNWLAGALGIGTARDTITGGYILDISGKTITDNQIVSTLAGNMTGPGNPGTSPPFVVASKDLNYNLNAELYNGYKEISYTPVMRAGYTLVGGGTLSASGAGGATTNPVYATWSARIMTISNGAGSHFGANGYYSITVPAVGTVITIYGGTGGTATVTAAGIPLVPASYASLYYVLTIGGVASDDTRWRIVNHVSTAIVPPEWIKIAGVNADAGHMIYWFNGERTKIGQSIDTTTGQGSVSPLTVAASGSVALSPSNPMSSGTATFSLVNDAAVPGVAGPKYYGYDAAGTRGFYNLPAGSSGTVDGTGIPPFVARWDGPAGVPTSTLKSGIIQDTGLYAGINITPNSSYGFMVAFSTRLNSINRGSVFTQYTVLTDDEPAGSEVINSSRYASYSAYTKTGTGVMTTYQTGNHFASDVISAGTTPNHFGYQVRVRVNTGAEVTNLTYFMAERGYGTTPGTIINRYGYIYDDLPSTDAVVTTNNWGFVCRNFNAGQGTSRIGFKSELRQAGGTWAIYTEGIGGLISADSYIGGRLGVGLGMSAPIYNLDVFATARISNTGGSAGLGLEALPTQIAYLDIRSDANARWRFWRTTTAEVASDPGGVGSDLAIQRYRNGPVDLGTVLLLERKSGWVRVGSAVPPTVQLDVSGELESSTASTVVASLGLARSDRNRWKWQTVTDTDAGVTAVYSANSHIALWRFRDDGTSDANSQTVQVNRDTGIWNFTDRPTYSGVGLVIGSGTHNALPKWSGTGTSQYLLDSGASDDGSAMQVDRRLHTRSPSFNGLVGVSSSQCEWYHNSNNTDPSRWYKIATFTPSSSYGTGGSKVVFEVHCGQYQSHYRTSYYIEMGDRQSTTNPMRYYVRAEGAIRDAASSGIQVYAEDTAFGAQTKSYHVYIYSLTGSLGFTGIMVTAKNTGYLRSQVAFIQNPTVLETTPPGTLDFDCATFTPNWSCFGYTAGTLSSTFTGGTSAVSAFSINGNLSVNGVGGSVGGSITTNGNISLLAPTTPTPNHAALVLSSANTTNYLAFIDFKTNGLFRWRLQKGSPGAAEGSGDAGNVGSDLSLIRMSDAGGIATMMLITRANGWVRLGSSVPATAQLDVTGAIKAGPGTGLNAGGLHDLSLLDAQLVKTNATTGRLEAQTLGGLGIISGSGTVNYHAKWTGTGTTLGTGVLEDLSSNVNINYIGASNIFRLVGVDEVVASGGSNLIVVRGKNAASYTDLWFGYHATTFGANTAGIYSGVDKWVGYFGGTTNINQGWRIQKAQASTVEPNVQIATGWVTGENCLVNQSLTHLATPSAMYYRVATLPDYSNTSSHDAVQLRVRFAPWAGAGPSTNEITELECYFKSRNGNPSALRVARWWRKGSADSNCRVFVYYDGDATKTFGVYIYLNGTYRDVYYDIKTTNGFYSLGGQILTPPTVSATAPTAPSVVVFDSAAAVTSMVDFTVGVMNTRGLVDSTLLSKTFIGTDINGKIEERTLASQNVITGSGQNNYVARWVDDPLADPLTRTLFIGTLRDTGTMVGIGKTPTVELDVVGNAAISSTLSVMSLMTLGTVGTVGSLRLQAHASLPGFMEFYASPTQSATPAVRKGFIGAGATGYLTLQAEDGWFWNVSGTKFQVTPALVALSTITASGMISGVGLRDTTLINKKILGTDIDGDLIESTVTAAGGVGLPIAGTAGTLPVFLAGGLTIGDSVLAQGSGTLTYTSNNAAALFTINSSANGSPVIGFSQASVLKWSLVGGAVGDTNFYIRRQPSTEYVFKIPAATGSPLDFQVVPTVNGVPLIAMVPPYTTGTENYLPRWGPGGKTLWDSLIRDDGFNILLGRNTSVTGQMLAQWVVSRAVTGAPAQVDTESDSDQPGVVRFRARRPTLYDSWIIGRDGADKFFINYFLPTTGVYDWQPFLADGATKKVNLRGGVTLDSQLLGTSINMSGDILATDLTARSTVFASYRVETKSLVSGISVFGEEGFKWASGPIAGTQQTIISVNGETGTFQLTCPLASQGGLSIGLQGVLAPTSVNSMALVYQDKDGFTGSTVLPFAAWLFQNSVRTFGVTINGDLLMSNAANTGTESPLIPTSTGGFFWINTSNNTAIPSGVPNPLRKTDQASPPAVPMVFSHFDNSLYVRKGGVWIKTGGTGGSGGPGTGTPNTVPKWNGTGNGLINSNIFDAGTAVAVYSHLYVSPYVAGSIDDDADFYINTKDTRLGQIKFMRHKGAANQPRWVWTMASNPTELITGTLKAGSDMTLYRYNDGGALVPAETVETIPGQAGRILNISRNSGVVDFEYRPTFRGTPLASGSGIVVAVPATQNKLSKWSVTGGASLTDSSITDTGSAITTTATFGSGAITSSGIVKGTQFESTAPIGTAPFVLVANNTQKVTFLNADLLDGVEEAVLARKATTITGQYSIAGGGDLSANRTLSLVGESGATMAVNQYYGTSSASANRGWQTFDDDLVKIAAIPDANLGYLRKVSTGPNVWQTDTTIPEGSVSFGNKTANTVFAGPASGVAAAPAFRALVPADLAGIAYVSGSGNGTKIPKWNAAAGSSTSNLTDSTISDSGTVVEITSQRLQVKPGANAAQVRVNVIRTQTAAYEWLRNDNASINVVRWALQMVANADNSEPVTGALRVGSNLVLNRYDDSGTLVGKIFEADRNSGIVTFQYKPKALSPDNTGTAQNVVLEDRRVEAATLTPGTTTQSTTLGSVEISGPTLAADRTLRLRGEVAVPGLGKYYGTPKTGTPDRGWYDLPAAGTTSKSSISQTFTLASTSDTINGSLVNGGVGGPFVPYLPGGHSINPIQYLDFKPDGVRITVTQTTPTSSGAFNVGIQISPSKTDWTSVVTKLVTILAGADGVGTSTDYFPITELPAVPNTTPFYFRWGMQANQGVTYDYSLASVVMVFYQGLGTQTFTTLFTMIDTRNGASITAPGSSPFTPWTWHALITSPVHAVLDYKPNKWALAFMVMANTSPAGAKIGFRISIYKTFPDVVGETFTVAGATGVPLGSTPGVLVSGSGTIPDASLLDAPEYYVQWGYSHDNIIEATLMSVNLKLSNQ